YFFRRRRQAGAPARRKVTCPYFSSPRLMIARMKTESLFSSVWALCAALLMALAAAPASGQPAEGCDSYCAAAAALVARFELRESAAPVRDRPGWARPKKIVVADLETAEVLRRIAPQATVVGVDGLRNFAGMADVVAGADVLVGLCTPEIVVRG